MPPPSDPALRLRIGTLIRDARTKLGLSQRDLTYATHIGAEVLSAWETGKTMPSVPSLLLVARVLDMDIGILGNLLDDDTVNGDEGAAA